MFKPGNTLARHTQIDCTCGHARTGRTTKGIRSSLLHRSTCPARIWYAENIEKKLAA